MPIPPKVISADSSNTLEDATVTTTGKEAPISRELMTDQYNKDIRDSNSNGPSDITNARQTSDRANTKDLIDIASTIIVAIEKTGSDAIVTYKKKCEGNTYGGEIDNGATGKDGENNSTEGDYVLNVS